MPLKATMGGLVKDGHSIYTDYPKKNTILQANVH